MTENGRISSCNKIRLRKSDDNEKLCACVGNDNVWTDLLSTATTNFRGHPTEQRSSDDGDCRQRRFLSDGESHIQTCARQLASCRRTARAHDTRREDWSDDAA